MCGIAGFIAKSNGLESSLPALVGEEMINAIKHRGPDDFGVWCSDDSKTVLAHSRLSILDLTKSGHQPMISDSKRYVLVFNGEIYNHLELRDRLSKLSWHGHSDTETLLACFEEWGVEKALASTVGMFALALWDVTSEILVLARDRMGEKPLYYGWQGEGENATFLFASELKAIKKHPAFVPKINRDALSLYMRHCYVPSPYSIYQNISKLEPACYLTVDVNKNISRKFRYWDLEAISNHSALTSYTGTEQDAVNDLDNLLLSTINQQMMADVPLGAFLSGGVDSSTVVALMQSQASKPIKTFTIGFDEESYNEAVYAKQIANHLNTDHTELYVTPKQALDVIPKLPYLYDEPFADSSQIPTFLVSDLARKQVTVSLSGDGGDELFAGYNRYVLAEKTWNKISKIPKSMRMLISNGLLRISPSTLSALLNPVQPILPEGFRQNNIGDKLHKAAGVLGSSDISELYLGLISQCDPEEYVIGVNEPVTALRGHSPLSSNMDHIQHMMYLDSITYLPDDILVKVDRATMANSLEGRVPFLDHRIVEFAWSLPQKYKIKNGVGKWVLREVLYKYVPQKLIDRPKMGFGVPIDSWLRYELRDWAESLLNESRLVKDGFFYPSAIRTKWEEHLSGKRNWQYFLWNVLMFQAWLNEESISNGVLN